MAFFDELKKNITEVSESVARKSNELVEVQRLKLKKTTLENDRKKDLERLGKIYFQKIADGEVHDQKAKDLFEKIVANNEAIDEVNEKMNDIRGVAVCPKCKADLDKNYDYCIQCGARIKPPVKVEETKAEAPAEQPDEEYSEELPPHLSEILSAEDMFILDDMDQEASEAPLSGEENNHTIQNEDSVNNITEEETTNSDEEENNQSALDEIEDDYL